jgi:hypothetical protein
MNVNKQAQARRAEEIARLKEAWKQSGKSKTSFCRENGINYMTFIGWFSQRRRRHSKQHAGFIPLQVQHTPGAVFAEVFLTKSRRLVFHQPVPAEYFHQLLR